MHRWILSILLLVLPFQAVWAVATPYCGHEVGGAAHFGHHDHKHPIKEDVEQSSLTTVGEDVDCGSCHLSAPATIPSAEVLLQPAGTAEQPTGGGSIYVSRTPSGPERPDISGSTTAERIGDGTPVPLLS